MRINYNNNATPKAWIDLVPEVINLIESYASMEKNQKHLSLRSQVVALDQALGLVEAIKEQLPSKISNSQVKADLANYIADYRYRPSSIGTAQENVIYSNMIFVLGRELFENEKLINKGNYTLPYMEEKIIPYSTMDLDRSNDGNYNKFVIIQTNQKSGNEVQKAVDAFLNTDVKFETKIRSK